MADEIKPDLPEVAAPENATIGDEGLEARTVEPEVVKEDVQAQVMGAPAKPVETVKVHETSVALDEFITDPNHPLAVIVPDAGRGSLDLPIHGLAAKTPEQVFADEAGSVSEVEGDRPTAADPNPAATDDSAPSDAKASRKAAK